jgi:hypothetical protein
MLQTIDFLSGLRASSCPLASGFGRTVFLKRRLVMVVEGGVPRTVSGWGSLGLLTLAVAVLPLAPSEARAVAEEKAAANPANNASPGEEKWRKEWAEVGVSVPPGNIVLPAYKSLQMRDDRRHFGINAAQEKKLGEIAAAFQVETDKVTQAYHQWQDLPPQERKTTGQEWHARFEQARHGFRKPIEDVLTPEQLAEYQHDIRGNTAWLIAEYAAAGQLQGMRSRFGIELSELQQQQGKRLVDEHRQSSEKNRKNVEERALAVLTPQQRQQLLARFTDAEVLVPLVMVPPVTQQKPPHEQKPSLNFQFQSGGDAMVIVDRNLTDSAVGLTAEQQAKLQSLQAKLQAAAQKVFERYELKAPANESHKAFVARQAEYRRNLDDYRRALEQFGREVVQQIDAVLQPQQAALLRAITRNETASWTLLNQNRAAMDDIHATAQQRANLRRILKDYESQDLRVPSMSVSIAAGEKALAILTPEQRKKLDEAIERNGW